MLTLLVILAVVADSLAAIAGAPSFREDYEYDPRSRTFYKLHRGEQPWVRAVDACEAEGAALATPASAVDAVALARRMAGRRALWVGVHDMFSEGEFVTLDGKNIGDVYVRWAQGQPDNLDVQNCVVLKSDGRSSDEDCSLNKAFICTKELTSLTENPGCKTYDTEYMKSDELNKCYKFHIVPRPWDDAVKICDAEQSYLGVVNSEVEVNFYKTILEMHPDSSLKNQGLIPSFHTGFSRAGQKFLTTKGQYLEESGFNVWSAGQPGEGGCGGLSRAGEYTTADCDTPAYFICEKDL